MKLSWLGESFVHINKISAVSFCIKRSLLMNLVRIFFKFYTDSININNKVRSVFLKAQNMRCSLYWGSPCSAESAKALQLPELIAAHTVFSSRQRAGPWAEMQPSSAGQALSPASFVVKLLGECLLVMGTGHTGSSRGLEGGARGRGGGGELLFTSVPCTRSSPICGNSDLSS